MMDRSEEIGNKISSQKSRIKSAVLVNRNTGEEVLVTNRSTFARKYGLVLTGVCHLINGVYKSYLGWVVKE